MRLPSGPAGIRTNTGSLSALARPTPYQLSHRVAYLRAMVNQHGFLIQSAHEAAKSHTQRSKGTTAATAHYRPQASELPVISPELTSELLHCLSTLPDPWPLAKVTIDMEKPSQWVSKMCRLYFADDYARRTVGVPAAAHGPEVESALKAVHSILPKLEARIVEFLSEWLVTFLMPAKHVLETRAPHLYFMFLKAYWFRELYLGLKVTASFDRSQSYTRIIDGQVRCITPDFKPKDLQIAWNVQFITVFVPAWMIPPIYHSLHRESIKNASSASTIGVKSVRPTWFEDIAPTNEPTSQTEQDPMHGLKLVVKEEALPLKEQPEFPALAELAKRGSPELQASANQPECYHRRANARNNHRTKWRWTPRTITHASRLAIAYRRSCPTKLCPPRRDPTRA